MLEISWTSKLQLFEPAGRNSLRVFDSFDTATFALLVCRILWGLPLGRPSVIQTVMCTMGNKMTKKYSITEARRNLPRLVQEAEQGKMVQLTRRDETVAVLVGHQKFEQLATGRRSFGEVYREFKTTFDLAKLDLDPDEIFASVRDTAPGRQVLF